MLYNNVSLLKAGDAPIDGYCYFTDIPFGDYTTIRQYQDKILEVLEKFDDICKKNNIKYFLYAGTLLGAVRHKGFIPWDDDVDVIMPREDYNKLKEVCEKEEIAPYVLVDAYISKDYTFTYPRFRKSDTTYIMRGEIANNFCSGIYIDIFCYDYLSSNKMVAAIQRRAFKNYHRLVSFGYSQHVHHITYFEEYFFKAISKIVGKRNLMKFFQKVTSIGKEEKSDRIIMDILLPFENPMNEVNKEYFTEQDWVEFEGKEFPVLQKSEQFLFDSYCKAKIKADCTIAEHLGERKKEPIQDRTYFEEYQFLPLRRSNVRHGRVAFDLNRSSDFYTEYYKSLFDKKKNNKNAIKDSRYRERSAKYATKLSEVSNDVFLAVQELQLKTFLEENKDKIRHEIENERYSWFNEKIYVYDFLWQKNIEKETINFVYETMLKAAEFEYTLRIKTKRDALYPELANDELDRFLDMQTNAWYLMYEGALDKAQAILEQMDKKWEKAIIHDILKMLIAFDNEQYDYCMSVADCIIEKNSNIFISLFCKGKCLYMKEEFEAARKYFEDAANTTLFMPFIQNALDYIQLLEIKKGL